MQNKKIKIMFLISLSIVLFLIAFLGYAFKQRNIIKENYETGKRLLEIGNYDQAINYFNELKEYKDGENLLIQAQQGSIYVKACELLNNNDYHNAIEEFEKIVDYNDSVEKIKIAKYELAISFYKSKKYDEAKPIFLELGDYEKSEYYLAKINLAQKEESQKIIYDEACDLLKKEKFDEALENFKSIIDYRDSDDKVKDCENQIKRRNLNNTISAGHRHTAAILSNGNALAVGDTDNHKCDLKGFNDMVSIAAGGTFTIGFDKKGKIKIAGRYNDNIEVDTTKDKWRKPKFIDVAAGQQFVVGLTDKGKVVGDGHGDDGQIDLKGWDHEDFIAIDAGWRFTVGLTKNKELKFSGLFGNQLEEFKIKRDEWKDVVNISAAGGDTTEDRRGGGHTVGLKSNGTVVAVGDKKWGQCEVYGKKWKNIVKVVAGDWYTVGLKENGQVLITGENDHTTHTEYIDHDLLKQMNKKKDIVDIAAGYGQTIFIHRDESISAFPFDKEQGTDNVLEWEKIKVSQ